LWGWLVTGAGSILLALVFARLALESPRPGGPFAYTNASFGKFAGFLVAWGHWIAAWTGNAAIAVACTSYLTVFFPPLKGNPIVAGSVTLGIVWLLFFVNLKGINAIGSLQLITTILKLIPLLALLLFGFFYFEPKHYAVMNVSELPALRAIMATCALTLWAFLGLESATVPAGSVKDPRRTIPRATVFGTSLVAVLYLGLSAVIFGILSPQELGASNAPFADAAKSMWGSAGYYFVAFGAVVSCFGALNGWMLIQAQVPHAAARAGLFPAIFGKEDAQGRPILGMTISTLLVSLLVLSSFTSDLVGVFTFMILLATMSSLIPYLFCSMASIMLSLVQGARPTFDWRRETLALLSFVYVIGAVMGAGQVVVYWGSILMLVSVPVYVWARWNERAGDPGAILAD
jgi:APA family basic amino acid/polyamine antiporter